MRINWKDALAGFALHALVFFVSLAMGYRMFISYDYYQLLSAEELRNRLWSSIFFLHSQPPMLNLILGIALWLEWFLHVRVEMILLVFHFVLGSMGAAALAVFATNFIRNRLLAWSGITLILLHPALYLTEFHYFYPFHELMILLLLALLIQRFLHQPRARTYAGICFLAVLLVYWRTLFHPLWAALLLGGLALPLFHFQKLPPLMLRQIRLSFGVSLLVLLAWPTKNLTTFGCFGYSSWQGANFCRGLKIDPLPPVDQTVPLRFQHVPVLTDIKKSDGSKNFNNYAIVREAKVWGELAIKSLRNDPTQILRKGLNNYWSATRFSGRHVQFGRYGLGPDLGKPAVLWMRAYELLLVQDFRSEEQLKDVMYRSADVPQRWLPSGFFILLPLVLIVAIFKTLRVWRSNPIEARTAVYLLFCIVWVMAMILLIDGSEGNRIRFSTEPYLLLLVFWVFSRSQRSGATP